MGLRTASALAACVCAYLLAVFETNGLSWADSYAPKNMRFSVTNLPPFLRPYQTERRVNPSLRHIASWISSVGASAAIADIDGDGFANDACIVDPRSDSVTLVQIIPRGSGNPEAKLVNTLIGSEEALRRLRLARISYDASRVAPMGCRIGDLNQDGRPDILVYFWGRPPLIFYNAESGFVPTELLSDRHETDIWNTNAALFADFDGDGYIDIFIGNYFADGQRLLDTSTSQHVEMNRSFSRATNGGRNRIFLRKPSADDVIPHFVEIFPFAEDEASGWTLAASAGDIDGDGLPELYVANDFGVDRFFHNRSAPGKLQFQLVEGRPSFMDPASTIMGRDSFKGMGVDIGDVNGDGLLDIAVSSITSPGGLHESQLLFLGTEDLGLMKQGVAPFRNVAEQYGFARTAFSWDVKFADLDNDGIPEIIQATGFIKGVNNRWPEVQELALGSDSLVTNARAWPNLRNADISGSEPRVILSRGERERFVNIASEVGLMPLGVARGIATSDIDGNGTIDWIEANQWADFRLILNQCSPCGEFLGIRLLLARTSELSTELTQDGRPPLTPGMRAFPAIGARVEVKLPSGKRLVQLVDGGGGHSGQRSPEVHFGLGSLDQAVKLPTRVSWKDSTGALRASTLDLSPGWHTVYLPW